MTRGDGKSKRKRSRKQPRSSRGHRVWKYSLSFLLGAGVAVALLGLLFRGGTGARKAQRPEEAQSLAALLSKSPEELQGVDIAQMNLLCAEGLPGAEGLNLDRCLATLDAWAARVRRETARHLYRLSDPQYAEHYRNSEAYFRASMLLQVLQEDCGVHYNKERVRDIDFTNSRDLFLHGMVGSDNGGTCVSMPVLYLAVGRRLDYPMYLALTKAHVFARWDDPESGERFNIEGTGHGFSSHRDEHYRTWPMTLTQADLATGHYLKSLTPAQELALSLSARGHCLEDTGCLPEARLAYAHAHHFDPQSPEYLGFLAQATGGTQGGPPLAASRRQVPRAPLADLRRVEAINEYNRRLMEANASPMLQVPRGTGGWNGGRSAVPAGPARGATPTPWP